MACVDVFMDLWAGHGLIFLPFTHISVGNCIPITQTQVSFRNNFRNEFKLWCWVKPVNEDPDLSPKLLIEERPLAVVLAALLYGAEDGREKLICGLFYSSSLHSSVVTTVMVSARILLIAKQHIVLGKVQKTQEC